MPKLETKDKPKLGSIYDNFNNKKSKGISNNSNTPKAVGKTSIQRQRPSNRQNITRGNR